MEFKVSCRFIDNLQPTNSNVKLLQCYGAFLTSFNPVMTQHIKKRALQETLHTPSARWGRDSGITSPYAKTQDCTRLLEIVDKTA